MRRRTADLLSGLMLLRPFWPKGCATARKDMQCLVSVAGDSCESITSARQSKLPQRMSAWDLVRARFGNGLKSLDPKLPANVCRSAAEIRSTDPRSQSKRREAALVCTRRSFPKLEQELWRNAAQYWGVDVRHSVWRKSLHVSVDMGIRYILALSS